MQGKPSDKFSSRKYHCFGHISMPIILNMEGYINRHGDYIAEPRFSQGSNFEKGYAYVYIRDLFFIIENQGELFAPFNQENHDIIPLKDDQLELISVSYKDKYGFMSRDGKYLINPIYDKIDHSAPFENGLARVCVNNEWFLIDKKGKRVFPQYQILSNFKGNFAKVKKNDKYGLINKEGEMVLPCIYDFLGLYSEGIWIVRLIEKYGYINSKGKQICDIKFDKVDCFENGLGKISINGKTGYMNKKGELIFLVK